jgi:hypothetical protein
MPDSNLWTARPLEQMRSSVVEADSGRSCWYLTERSSVISAGVSTVPVRGSESLTGDPDRCTLWPYLTIQSDLVGLTDRSGENIGPDGKNSYGTHTPISYFPNPSPFLLTRATGTRGTRRLKPGNKPVETMQGASEELTHGIYEVQGNH